MAIYSQFSHSKWRFTIVSDIFWCSNHLQSISWHGLAHLLDADHSVPPSDPSNSASSTQQTRTPWSHGRHAATHSFPAKGFESRLVIQHPAHWGTHFFRKSLSTRRANLLRWSKMGISIPICLCLITLHHISCKNRIGWHRTACWPYTNLGGSPPSTHQCVDRGEQFERPHRKVILSTGIHAYKEYHL